MSVEVKIVADNAINYTFRTEDNKQASVVIQGHAKGNMTLKLSIPIESGIFEVGANETKPLVI